jgi:hypothetical protein
MAEDDSNISWNVPETALLPFNVLSIPDDFLNLTEDMDETIEVLDSCMTNPIVRRYFKALVIARHQASTAVNVVGKNNKTNLKVDKGYDLVQHTFARVQLGSEVIHLGDWVRVKIGDFEQMGSDSVRRKTILEVPQSAVLHALPSDEIVMQVITIKYNEDDEEVEIMGLRGHVEDMEDHPELMDPRLLRKSRMWYSVPQLFVPRQTPVDVHVDINTDSNIANDAISYARERTILTVKPEKIVGKFHSVYLSSQNMCLLQTRTNNSNPRQVGISLKYPTVNKS